MKCQNKLRLLIVVAALSSCFITTAEALTENQVERKAFASTVLVVTYDSNGRQIGSGSGFFVSRDWVATNYHVIKDATSVECQDAATGRQFSIRSAAINSDADLAILRTIDFTGTPISLGNSDTIRKGDTIYVAGYPGGNRSFKKAKIRGTTGIKGCADAEFEITSFARIAPGSSGGPVLNTNGEAVGVAVRVYMRFGLLSLNGYAVRINYLRYLIADPGGFRSFPITHPLSDCSTISRGNMYAEMGYYADAIFEYNQVLSKNPGLTIGYLNRALARYELGDVSTALSDLSIAMSLAESRHLRSLIQQVRDSF